MRGGYLDFSSLDRDPLVYLSLNINFLVLASRVQEKETEER